MNVNMAYNEIWMYYLNIREILYHPQQQPQLQMKVGRNSINLNLTGGQADIFSELPSSGWRNWLKSSARVWCPEGSRWFSRPRWNLIYLSSSKSWSIVNPTIWFLFHFCVCVCVWAGVDVKSNLQKPRAPKLRLATPYSHTQKHKNTTLFLDISNSTAGMVCLPEQLNNLKGESPSIIGENDCHSRKSSEIKVQRKPALKRIVSSKYGNTFDRSCVYTQYTVYIFSTTTFLQQRRTVWHRKKYKSSHSSWLKMRTLWCEPHALKMWKLNINIYSK